MTKAELVDLAGILKYETERAYLIDFGNKKVWLPKQHCERNDDGTFTMPTWLAVDKELV